MKKRPKPVVLCILDGWGERAESAHNAIALARTPHWDALMQECPHTQLATSGLAVGLPAGQMGNSEVGHMTIGAGRVIFQNLPRIDKAITEGGLAKHHALQKLMAAVKKSGGTCHLMGLVSDGGVHAHSEHILALARILSAAGIPVRIHAFLDGRDTPPDSAKGYMEHFLKGIAGLKDVQIATVSGRYYGMDRDNRWERTALAYQAIVQAEGAYADSPLAAIAESYKLGKTDEFVLPAVIGDYSGMKDGDALLMANFRSDRARQTLSALVDPEFKGFARGKAITFSAQVGMVEYSDALSKHLATLFPSDEPEQTLGEIVSRAGLKQLRIAETEKYAHVTFFFNGGQEAVFPGEDRILIPSPNVATYDEKPEMSAFELTDKLVEAITSGKYDLIVVNYANGDMVGHTGDEAAAIKAVEAVDKCLGRVREAVEKQGGALLITADHGNAEQMVDPTTGSPHTAHTTGPVPLIVAGAQPGAKLAAGGLCDIAPTVLALMTLPQPKIMTGTPLLMYH